MHIILTRYGSLPGIGTFGYLRIGVAGFYTVEREWLDNQPFKSCVPSGEYKLEPHSSEKYPNTWALVGETVSHHKSDKQRYCCVIHKANYPSDVMGCIGPGALLTHINGRLGVTSSKYSMGQIRQLLGPGSHTLTIRWADYV